eukprot:COSAG01_NODE_25108_length_755_cov_1.175305_2_plen_78_part_00
MCNLGRAWWGRAPGRQRHAGVASSALAVSMVWGAHRYTPLCNANGGVEADLTVTKMGDNSWYHHLRDSMSMWTKVLD